MKINVFKKLFLISTIVFSFHTYSSIKPIPSEISDLANKSLLTDIVNAGDNLVAVGERGHIVYSADGISWQQADVPVNVLLTSIAFADENLGFAVGHDATILKTEDSGKTWSIIQYAPEIDKPFLSIIANQTRVIAVGAYGMYVISEDGGNEWITVFHDELLLEDDRLFLQDIKEYEPESYEFERRYLLPHFNDVAIISGTYYLAGEAGFAASSQDGMNWQRIQSDYQGSYFSITGNGSQLHLAGLRGTLLESNDSGVSWKVLKSEQPATINSAIENEGMKLFFANSGNVFIQRPGQALSHFAFEDGKAVMAGVIADEVVILATESGIKRVKLNQIVKK